MHLVEHGARRLVEVLVEPRIVARAEAPQRLDGGADRRERVLHLVRDAAGDLAPRGDAARRGEPASRRREILDHLVERVRRARRSRRSRARERGAPRRPRPCAPRRRAPDAAARARRARRSASRSATPGRREPRGGRSPSGRCGRGSRRAPSSACSRRWASTRRRRPSACTSTARRRRARGAAPRFTCTSIGVAEALDHRLEPPAPTRPTACPLLPCLRQRDTSAGLRRRSAARNAHTSPPTSLATPPSACSGA